LLNSGVSPGSVTRTLANAPANRTPAHITADLLPPTEVLTSQLKFSAIDHDDRPLASQQA
jgi:hypothetical protein